MTLENCKVDEDVLSPTEERIDHCKTEPSGLKPALVRWKVEVGELGIYTRYLETLIRLCVGLANFFLVLLKVKLKALEEVATPIDDV